MKPFRLGINMAGAISAGAYTAGVFDFLLEALRQWEKAKAENKAVPKHNISIEVLSGASAGGICSGLGALSLYDETNPHGESNALSNSSRLYGAWVKDIDISDLLKSDDLNNGSALVSLLDCTVLDSIAKKRLQWQGTPKRPSYVSPNLTLFLSLTNLRGVPYSVDFSNAGSFEEHISYHSDQIQFEVLEPGTPPKSKLSYQLPVNNPSSEGWEQLKAAALATGAFPIGLAARNVRRRKEEYEGKFWRVSVPGAKDDTGNCVCERDIVIQPAWGISNVDSPFDTVNVDGGVTNNNPFECARRYLEGDGLQTKHGDQGAIDVDHAVLTIAPFPGDRRFSPEYETAKESTIFGMVPNLVSALISQSRFQGEALTLLKDETVFSSFVIAPNDTHVEPPVHALQCGSLGAFGGFLYQGFRSRDYQLGRRNCQRFLQEHFVLPAENPLVAEGIASNRQTLIDEFRAKDSAVERPPDVHTAAWMPVIPLYGSAQETIDYPERKKINTADLDRIVATAADRINAVIAQLARGNGFFGWLFGWEIRIWIKLKGKSFLKRKLVDELQREQSL